MSEETKTKERTDQVTLWDKVKTLFTSVRERVVAFFTTTAGWLKGLSNNRPWIKYAAIAIVILALSGGFGLWRDRQLTRRINTLGSENQAITQQIKVVSAERDEIKAQYEELKKQVTTTQANNDSNIKEAGKNAYKKVMSMRTADILNYYNTVYRPGVVQRNAVRNRQNSGNGD